MQKKCLTASIRSVVVNTPDLLLVIKGDRRLLFDERGTSKSENYSRFRRAAFACVIFESYFSSRLIRNRMARAIKQWSLNVNCHSTRKDVLIDKCGSSAWNRVAAFFPRAGWPRRRAICTGFRWIFFFCIWKWFENLQFLMWPRPQRWCWIHILNVIGVFSSFEVEWNFPDSRSENFGKYTFAWNTEIRPIPRSSSKKYWNFGRANRGGGEGVWGGLCCALEKWVVPPNWWPDFWYLESAVF